MAQPPKEHVKLSRPGDQNISVKTTPERSAELRAFARALDIPVHELVNELLTIGLSSRRFLNYQKEMAEKKAKAKSKPRSSEENFEG